MKKYIPLLLFILFYNCGSEIVENRCFSGVRLNEVIQLNNPIFVNLQTANGFAYTNVGGRNILIINKGTTPKYAAYDRECPEKNCNSLITFDYPIMRCPCDNKEYNFLQEGAPLDGEGCHALVYNVLEINSSSLQISR